MPDSLSPQRITSPFHTIIGNVGTNDEDIDTVTWRRPPGRPAGVSLRSKHHDPSNYPANAIIKNRTMA